MKSMTNKQYNEYKKAALKHGDDIFDQNNSNSLIRMSLYEADKSYKTSIVKNTLVILGGISAAAGAFLMLAQVM